MLSDDSIGPLNPLCRRSGQRVCWNRLRLYRFRWHYKQHSVFVADEFARTATGFRGVQVVPNSVQSDQPLLLIDILRGIPRSG